MRAGVGFAFCVILLAACGADTSGGAPELPPSNPPLTSSVLRITEPSPGAILRNTRIEVLGTIESEASVVDSVTVGGVIAEVDDEGSWRTTIEIAEGIQRIVATSGGEQASVDVLVDATAPEIHIERPSATAYMVGNEVTIRGSIEDLTSCTLRIGDGDLAVDNGRFETTMLLEPGAHRIRLTSTDLAGNKGSAFASFFSGEYRSHDELMEDALNAHIGEDAVASLTEILEASLQDLSLKQAALKANPVYESTLADVILTDADYDSLDLDLTLGEGGMLVEVVVHDVHIEFRASSVTSAYGELSADELLIVAPVELAVVDGEPNVSVVDPELEFIGFDFSIDYLPDFVEDTDFIQGAVRDFVYAALLEAMDDALDQAIEGKIADLGIHGEYQIFDRPLSLDTELQDLQVDKDGIFVNMGLSLAASGTLVHESPATLRLGENSSPQVPRSNRELEVALSTDLVNAALSAAWSAGRFDFTHESVEFQEAPLQVSHLALFIPSVVDRAPPDATVDLVIETVMPPLAQIDGEGEARIDLVDVRVTLRAEGNELLTVSLGMSAGLSLAVSAEHELSFSLTDVEMTADLVEGPPGTPHGDTLHALITPMLENKVMDLTDVGSFPLPSIQGLELDMLNIELSDHYLRVASDIEIAPQY